MIFMKYGAVALAISLGATAAGAATLQVNSVSGDWIGYTPDGNVFGINEVNTADYTQLNWGDPKSGFDQSGYRFEGIIPPVVETQPGMVFDLGEFTHFNNPIRRNPGDGQLGWITSASLEVTFDLLIDGVDIVRKLVFDFTHDETPNEGVDAAGNCTYGGRDGIGDDAAGCRDRVDVTKNEGLSEKIIVNNMMYDISISGFEVDGELFDFFLTEEESANRAILVGTYSVSEIPLPAAGWMLIAGLGGLVAMKRRRKQAEA